MTPHGTAITILMEDGTPDGLRRIEMSNWMGLGLVAPRSIYPKVRACRELQRPAIYVLRGTSEINPGQSKLYIGETNNALTRLDYQAKNIDWWDELIVFVSSNESLNKAHVKYIEARLFEIASTAKRAELVYGQTPHAPALSTFDIAAAEGFLASLLLIYPVLGVDAFEKPTSNATGASDQPLLILSGKDAEATGRDLPAGFVVYKGARARRDSVASIHSYLDALRDQLLSAGLLEDDGTSLVLTQDYAFTSPSNAAGVFLGRSANGRIEWRDEHQKTLKKIQEATLPDTDEEQA